MQALMKQVASYKEETDSKIQELRSIVANQQETINFMVDQL